MKKLTTKKLLLLLSILFPLFIVGIVYFIHDVYPFGMKTIMKSDMYTQMYPMLINLYDSIKSGELIYSFKIGLGAPFYRDYFNYMSSPINFIILLFKRENIHLAIPIIIGIKIVLSCLSMTYYLMKKYGEKLILIIPSLMYAFNGWMLAHFFNIKWTDAMIFLPLITLGIEYLVDKGKVKFYVITLAIMMFSNFYIAYMICVWCVIYFIVYNLYRIKKEGSLSYKINELSRNFLRFLSASFLTAGICTFFLLPNIYASSTFEAMGGFEGINNYRFSFVDFVASHLSFTDPSLFSRLGDDSNSPNVLIGILFLILFPIFIANKNISKKKKYMYISLMIIISCFFLSPHLDLFINGFHIPNGFPYRYSFLYSFVMVIILTEILANWDNNVSNRCGILLSLAMITLLYFYSTNKIDANALLKNTMFFIIYSIFLIVPMKTKKWSIIFIIVFVECLFNYDFIIKNGTLLEINYDETNYIKYRDKYQEQKLNTFSRYDPGYLYQNHGYIYDYYAFDAFTSTLYGKLSKLEFALGYLSDFFAVGLHHETPNQFPDMLLGIDTYVDYNGNMKDNPYSLSLFVGLDEKIELDVDIYNEVFIMDNQNFLANQILSDKELFSVMQPKSSKVFFENEDLIIYEYTFDAPPYYDYFPGDQYLYSYGDVIYCPYDIENQEKTMLLQALLEYKEHDAIFLRTVISSNYKTVKIGYRKDKISEPTFYKLNEDVLEEIYQKLKQDELEVLDYNTKEIITESNYEKEKYVLVSIPYDKGWHVNIDGKEIKTEPMMMDALLSFKVPAGKHKIKLVYKIPYLKIGIIISIISGIILLIWDIKIKKVK